ncbi:MAG TPA: UDP-N-acetylmuramyl-tripeptide synthetase [Candidatus Methylomirabilis sp.]|nr:UDP-N-acetylmuramyl-tripeptide synthetase [Candidatus Methylomirabilis sp.]
MHLILNAIRKIVPVPVFDLYHRTLSWLAAVWYGHPSRRMVVIGVTGTSGKTTTAYLISKALEASGAATGCTTTAFFKIGDRAWSNATKMTMVGRFQLQRLLREMADAGCRYAVVETTSQGIVQHRHEHVAYDVCVFTNLWPEHIEAHGGFENYKRAKIRLFDYAASLPPKVLDGKTVPRVAVLNAGSEYAKDFVVEGFGRVIMYEAATASGGRPSVLRLRSGQALPVRQASKILLATDVVAAADHVTFMVDGVAVRLNLPGAVNVENALAALAAAGALDVPFADAARALSRAPGLPGRYERVDEGQAWTVIVDFAFEPGAMKKLYELVASLDHRRVIHVLGSAGGGRDASRRPVLGRIAGKNADVVVVTNEDPYDDDPWEIVNQVANGAVDAGKKDGHNLYRILDRRDAIRLAMKMAKAGDVVLITGKGNEPVMAVAGGRKIPWSDAEEAKKAIREITKFE